MKYLLENQLEDEQFYLLENLNYIFYLGFVTQGKERKLVILQWQYLELKVVI